MPPSQLILRHDQYFKRLLDRPGTAAALLREHLPPGLAARLTDDPPEPLPTSFISDELDESRTDRLYRARTRDGAPVLVYTLVEHKSAPDQRLGLQLLGYRTRILKWWDDTEGRAPDGTLRRLPMLVSLVVYNGEARWGVPLTLAGATEGGEDEELRPWLTDFRYSLLDLGCTLDHDLSRHPVLGFGLKVLKHGARRGDLRRTLALLVRDALEVGFEEVVVLVRFVLREPNELEREVVRDVLAEVAPGKEDGIMSIALQEWQQEWLAEGMAKGRVQGIEEGIERGRAETLLRQMRRRFGPLSDDAVQRVQAATSEDLDRWTDAILDAADLDELFGAPKH